LYPSADISVYNRWGQLIFDSKGNFTGWDATYNGYPLPTDTYHYIIKLDDGSKPDGGTVTIIR